MPRTPIRFPALALAIALLSCTTSSEPTSGSTAAALHEEDAGPGTDSSVAALSAATLITTCAELQAVQDDLRGDYRLANDIDCTGFDAGDGRGFRPLGAQGGGFRGTLDGDGHIITGLHIDRRHSSRVGLFGDLRGATVTRVGLEGAYVRGRRMVGGLAGRMRRDATIEQSFVRGEVRALDQAGGMAGFIVRGSITESYSQADLSCHGAFCGVLVGRFRVGEVTDSYAAGDARHHQTLVGARFHTGAINDSFYDCSRTGWCRWWIETAITTATLQHQPFLEAAGWNFADTWAFAAPGTYACLQWEDGCGDVSCAPDDVTCDGVDDDCDATNDEDYVSEDTLCGIGACEAIGATACIDGAVDDDCTPGTPAADDASCDGVDDDCDATNDEDYASTPTNCGVGACASTGATSCVAGSVEDGCVPGPPAPEDVSCDAIDDDCDGAADEGFESTPTTCGQGVCASAGSLECVSGAASDSCVPSAATGPDDDCNGTDEDCDGTSDESFASAPTTCGVGACAAAGATTCDAGTPGDSCTPGAATGDDSDCDGVDDDCDGSVDEAYTATSTSCGVGACGATGTTSCVAGAVVDSCSPGTGSGADEVCDGVDSDCDGSTDEGYASSSTACGVGVCTASGATSCVAGIVEDSCAAGAPTGDDSVCDGADNDCDGSTDEAYASTATSCGQGVCTAAGTTSCVAGAVTDSCSAGSPTGDDSVCDGADEDCDGATDEAYAPTATSCGQGVCAASGETSCVAGSVADSCSAGVPTGDDSVCDGTDADCDGAVDEAYASSATSCGTGVCAAAGSTSCVGGAITDSCSPATSPQTSDVPAGTSVLANRAADDQLTGARRHQA